MYKTKLQELCHKRQWGLPKYCAMKDGPDHTPSFKSSVIVNGLSFDSPFPSNSSKKSQNDAAKVAFLHYTSPSPSSPVSNESDIQETCDGPDTKSYVFPVKEDMQCDYKSQLHNYAHWKNFDFPFYSSTIGGPSQAPCFKATVTVDGHAFQSSQFFATLKEAENSAAKAALMSMMTDDSQEENSGFYKNSLQELAQKEGLSIPVYKTINTGAPHMPTFFSFVEIEGERFYGKAGKTKKAAEIKAAKVAYTFLKEVAMSRSTDPGSASLVTNESQSDFGSDLTTAAPVISLEEHSAESDDKVQKVYLSEKTSNLKIGSEDSIPSHSLVSNIEAMTEHQNSSSFCEPVPTLFKDGSVSPDMAGNESNSLQPGAPVSCLLGERVRVYLSYPNVVFPKGITVLPISESKWVAVSLEYPNEQGC